MIILNRLDTKVRKVGTSYVTTIPWQVRTFWNLKEGDRLIHYQLNEMLAIFPLAEIGINGQPKSLKKILECLPSLDR